MLIRSQDKSRLISLNNTRELRFWECAQGFNITDCVCPIGHYSTKAKAMKVLDMIQDAYADAKLNEILIPDVCKSASESQQEKENTSIAKDIRNAFMKKMVFQIPDDESVEV